MIVTIINLHPLTSSALTSTVLLWPTIKLFLVTHIQHSDHQAVTSAQVCRKIADSVTRYCALLCVLRVGHGLLFGMQEEAALEPLTKKI